jgi:hypothetical protein
MGAVNTASLGCVLWTPWRVERPNSCAATSLDCIQCSLLCGWQCSLCCLWTALLECCVAVMQMLTDAGACLRWRCSVAYLASSWLSGAGGCGAAVSTRACACYWCCLLVLLCALGKAVLQLCCGVKLQVSVKVLLLCHFCCAFWDFCEITDGSSGCHGGGLLVG